MENIKDFKYELGHDQFKNLVLEIQAVKAFNYKQFKNLTIILPLLLQEEQNDTKLVDLVRELSSFNFKQFKKLNFIINQMMTTIDPNWKPVVHKKKGVNQNEPKSV